MRSIIATLVLCCAVSAAAQSSFSMGALPDHGTLTLGSNPITLIDVSHPATQAGVVTAVSLRYSLPVSGSCPSAFRIKFIRPNVSLTGYSVIAERGTFNAATPVVDAAISPGVPVQAGDLIAVTQLTSCGGVFLTNDDPAAVTLDFAGDISGSGSFTAANTILMHGRTLNARAVTAVASDLAGIIPAAGAAQGVGAFFRTAVQLANPNDGTMTGKLVFHPANKSASASDPSISYSIGPHAVFSRDDIVTALGATGLGSIDITNTLGGVPLVVARVYNDRGSDGSDGFVEPMIRTSEAMSDGASGTIVLPPDLTKFRVNVGIRTLEDGATLGTYYTSSNNTPVAAQPLQLPENYFTQMPLGDLLKTTAYKANGLAGIQVTSGSAIIYVSIIDNKTGDSSVYFLGR